jgi:signal transduction histidine kinase
MYNAAKHSKGSQITVKLLPAPKEFTVFVSDDGTGFEPSAKKGSGLGLGTMRYRANLIGGVLKIDSAPGRGTTVSCKIPLRVS